MDAGFSIVKGSRQEQYESLLAQLPAILEGENDVIARMANITACLKYQFDWHWVGFYRVSEKSLVLGPFQGPVACSRIAKGKGVCGSAWQKDETVIVDDVTLFPGHIACSPLSRSEIVVPVHQNNEIIGVLDVDSEKLADFSDTDREFLEKICSLLS